ncbi:hypothetical protein LVJ94_05850 [Pendulispora rubella]|uniref:Uncharacterized protein n=1 Tax=Pendulispora rubella TaxID=2741070 RepID=A0ABZ2L761_9BACT
MLRITSDAILVMSACPAAWRLRIALENGLRAEWWSARASMEKNPQMKTIGTTTTYKGNEFSQLQGATVLIRSIVHRAMDRDRDVYGPSLIVSDELLAMVGGVTNDDRVEIVRVLTDGRPGVLCYHVRAADLERFADVEGSRARSTEIEPISDSLRCPDSVRSP